METELEERDFHSLRAAFDGMLRRSSSRTALTMLNRGGPALDATEWATQVWYGLKRNCEEFCAESSATEAKKCSKNDVLRRDENEKDLLASSRSAEIGWIHKACYYHGLDYDCFFLARSLYDRVLELRKTVKRVDEEWREVLPAGVSTMCFYLAAKVASEYDDMPFCPTSFIQFAKLETDLAHFLEFERRLLRLLDYRLGECAFRERQLMAIVSASAMPFLEELPEAEELGRKLVAQHRAFRSDERDVLRPPEKILSFAVFWLSKLLSELATFEPELNPPKASPLSVSIACFGWAMECAGVSRARWSSGCWEVGHFASSLPAGELVRCWEFVSKTHKTFLTPNSDLRRHANSVATKFFSRGYCKVSGFVPDIFERA